MEPPCTFSIVTVSYNCADAIRKTLESVVGQDCADKEYIIIDGGSTDGTADIIREYEEHLTYWCSEPDGGIYQGMNKGIARAQGQWIIFMNAGDVFADEHVLSQVASFLDEEKYDILYGDILTEKKGELHRKIAAEPCNKQRMYFCHQAAFVQTRLLKQMPFDTRFQMSADFYFFKYCYLSGYKFRHIPVTIALYDSHGVSNRQRLKGLYENIRVIKELDKGWDKIRFLLKLYYVIYWIKLRKSF